MPFERTEFPSFSWSHSRRDRFQDCPRQYFYHYYASHNGWEWEAPEFARVTYRLKNLTSLALEIGGAVHEAASVSLQAARTNGEVPSVDDMYKIARIRMNKVWEDSKDRQAWERSPKWKRMMQEAYYDTGPSPAKIREAKETLIACLTNLSRFQSYREALAAPICNIKNVEGFDTFRLDDVDIYAVPDLVYASGNGTWTIADWKSGKRQADNSAQAKAYALYIHERHGIDPANIIVRTEWLQDGSTEEVTFTMEDLTDFKRSVLDSVAAMRGYLEDTELNKPLPKEAFSLRENTSLCKFCNFYKLDRDEIASAYEGPF